MSFQAMSWAVNVQTENAGQKLVLLMLANHSNGHTGQCNPSHKLLASECCMGVSTLKNHIARLAENGFLIIVHKSLDGVSLPNQYILEIGGVGQNLAEGRSKSDGGVGQNLATKQELKTGIEPLFAQFWKAYPKKVAPDFARKAFDKRKPDQDLTDKMVEAIERQKNSQAWLKDGGQYIPNPATWLNQGRWMDEDSQEESGTSLLAGGI